MIWTDFDFMLIVPAFLAGTIVLSIHVPLGQEVLKRGIIFIDIAIAQIAALGVISATVLGGKLATWQIQLFAGLSAIAGADSLAREKLQRCFRGINWLNICVSGQWCFVISKLCTA